jgi:hypothetical protein
VKDAQNGRNSAKNAGFIGSIRKNAPSTLRSGAIDNIYKSAFYSILVMTL